MTFLKNTKAQGTIEYLVIIAIVIVIALIVVGILTGFLNTEGINQSTDQLQQTIGTQGISITDIVTDTENGILNIKNTTGDNITITSITSTNKDITVENVFDQTTSTGNTTQLSLERLGDSCTCAQIKKRLVVKLK